MAVDQSGINGPLPGDPNPFMGNSASASTDPTTGLPQITTVNSAALQAANQQAMLAYYEERLHLLEIPQMQNQNQQALDKLAFDKAQQVWTQVYQESSLNGLTPNLDANGQPTGTFGTSPTLAAQKQTADIQSQQNTTSLDYLKLLSTMNTPQNMFQYLRVLQNTPQGLQDVVNQANGRPLGAGIGAPTQAAPQSGVGGVHDQLIRGGPVGMDANTPIGGQGGLPYRTVTPDHIAAAASGAVQGLLAGTTYNNYGTSNTGSPSGTVNPDGSVSQESPGGLIQDMNNPGGVATGQDMNAAASVGNPLQWNARGVTAMGPTQKGALEAATQYTNGITPDDQEAIFKSGLPIYGGPTHGTVTGLGY